MVRAAAVTVAGERTSQHKGDEVHRKKRRSVVLATLSVFTFVAVAACGGDDDDDESGDTDGTEAVSGTDAADSATTIGETATTTAGSSDTGSTEPVTTDGSEVEPGPGENHVTDEGEPVKGGTLVYGIEADTANPWAPFRASVATAGYIPLSRRSATRCSTSATTASSTRCSSSRSRPTPTTPSGRCTSARASRSTTAPRSTAPRSSSTSTPTGSAPLTAAGLTPIDTVTASGQDVVITTKEAVGRPARRARVRVDGVHDVADVVGEPARRAAAHRGWSRLRRRGRGDAGRR